MPWYYSDAAVGGLVALLAIMVTTILATRDRYERQLVVIDPTRTRVLFEEGSGEPHRAILSLLSTGNRPTVIRDVRLVAADGKPFVSYRGADRIAPALPFRLDAPDERVVTLELTDREAQQLDHIDVEFLGGTKPVRWPYIRLSAAATGTSSASAILSTAPAATDTTTAPDHAGDVLTPVQKPTAPKAEQLQVGEKATDTLTPAPTSRPK
ncbi:hypothetical protein [Anaeromyxobacter diazotrophicus]|nr:hypothetical protein [Anaeromyxobacter diazotrophicus]